jgi:hypothetical protein
MKCISLWQPWASALFLRYPANTLPGERQAPEFWLKPDETRSWPTAFRGPLAIHAAAKITRPDADFDPQLDDILFRLFRRRTADLPRGCILGYCVLDRCSKTINVERRPMQYLWGDYRERGDDGKVRYAWSFGDERKLLPCPISWKGSQGFFDVPDSLFPQSAPTEFQLRP